MNLKLIAALCLACFAVRAANVADNIQTALGVGLSGTNRVRFTPVQPWLLSSNASPVIGYPVGANTDTNGNFGATNIPGPAFYNFDVVNSGLLPFRVLVPGGNSTYTLWQVAQLAQNAALFQYITNVTTGTNGVNVAPGALATAITNPAGPLVTISAMSQTNTVVQTNDTRAVTLYNQVGGTNSNNTLQNPTNTGVYWGQVYPSGSYPMKLSMDTTNGIRIDDGLGDVASLGSNTLVLTDISNDGLFTHGSGLTGSVQIDDGGGDILLLQSGKASLSTGAQFAGNGAGLTNIVGATNAVNATNLIGQLVQANVPSSLNYAGAFTGNSFALSNNPTVLQLLHQTRANLANLEAGSNVQFTVDLIGDSDMAFELWTKPLWSTLQAAYGNAGMGWTAANDSAAINGDSGALPPILRDIIQIRVTYTGTWTFTNDNLTVPLISYALSSDTGTPATLTWTNVPGSGANLWFLDDATVGGSFQILTNGVLFKTINSVTASTTLTYTNIPLPFNITNYNIQCKLVSGQMAICGIVPTNNLPGLRINNRGHTGSAAKEWAAHTVLSPVSGSDTNALLTLLSNDAPQLVCINLGKNDILHYTIPGTYTNDLTTIISQVQKYSTNCDILLIGQGDMAPPSGSAPLEPLMRAVSVSQNLPYIDIYDRMPNYNQGTNQPASGFMDAFHFSPALYLQEADLIARDAFGISFANLKKLAEPIWYYQMPLDYAGASDAGFTAAQTDPTFSVRKYFSLAANTAGAMDIKVPNGRGFTRVISKYTIAPVALLGATNFYFVINTTGERFAPYFAGAACQSEVYPVTNGQAIVAWATNYFDNDTAPRDLLIRFFKDTANSGAPTNGVALINAEFFGVRSNAWLGQVVR